MEAIWWLFGLAVLMGGLVLLSQSLQTRDEPPPPDDPVIAKNELIGEIARDVTIKTSMSSREYDPNGYRIDGLAQPEYRITYVDADGSITEREIYIDTWHESAGTTFYKCWCFLKDERRTFRQDRIQRAVNLRTKRPIKNIAQHQMRY